MAAEDIADAITYIVTWPQRARQLQARRRRSLLVGMKAFINDRGQARVWD